MQILNSFKYEIKQYTYCLVEFLQSTIVSHEDTYLNQAEERFLRQTSMDNIAKLHIMQIRSNFLILHQNIFVKQNFVPSNIEEF